jgi:hypothetical protein
MAQPNLEPFKIRGVTLKAEVTEGTDSVPIPGIDGFLLMNGTSGTEFDKVERVIDRPHFSNYPFAVANERAFIEGDFELYPPATPGTGATSNPHIDVLLRMAGMARTLDGVGLTTRYTPISTGIISASAYWWHVDAHRKILGARAGINSLRMGVGSVAGGNARILGGFTTVSKETLPAITLPDYSPAPVTSANTVTHFSTLDSGPTVDDLLVWGKELNISFGTALNTKEFTSKKVNQISDRLATWTLRIARADLAEFNPWAIRSAGILVGGYMRQTYGVLTQELGFRGQIEGIQEVDIDNDLGWELSGPCIASSAGGDELYLEFKDNT